MTLYVGEQIRIVFSGKEYNGDTLTDANVNGVTIVILHCDSTVPVVNEEDMTWVSDETLWEYKWATTGLIQGTYKYRITVIGSDGNPSVEWGRVRLARQPSIVT